MLRAIGVLAVSFFLAGCTDDSNLLTVTAIPTLLTVEPLRFRGGVRCGAPELQSYVVALTRVSAPTTLVAVSVPAGCTTPTSFGSPPVEVGAFYVAKIDGYDRPACDTVRQIYPAGCVEAPAGSALLSDHETGGKVPPRWTTWCGPALTSDVASPAELDASDTEAAPPAATTGNPLITPTQALLSTEVFFHACQPLAVPPADASTPADASGGGADSAEEGADDESDGGAADASSQPTDDAAKSPTGDARPDDAPDSGANGG